MSLTLPLRHRAAPVCGVLVSLALGACGSTVSTASFKGEEHAVAQTISNLQADATAGEEKKICARDLAAPIVRSLGGAKACEAAIKNQLAETDSLQLEVRSIKLSGATASARVKSTYSGKTRASSLALVKEGGAWRISGLQ
jgi:hypothetical protein